jgi:hypothetical protein
MVRAELVKIAKAEVGNCEGKTSRPYMKKQPGNWCYDFVAWVYEQSGCALPSPLSLPHHAARNQSTAWQPKPGDMIKFTIQHYGMVEKVMADGRIRTLEGNFNRCVATRDVGAEKISYYGSLEEFLASH